MAKASVPSAPPQEVLLEFLRNLQRTIAEFGENLVPVLRGSLLLRHWFGEEARTAADVDLECFEGPRTGFTDGHGNYGEYESLVDFGKAMCRYAAQYTQYYQWSRPPQPRPDVEFRDTEAPEGGSSLWAYGTPGERYYTGWVWHAHGGATGQLQIDIAEAGTYNLGDISVTDIELGAGGNAFSFPAYTPEMMLAAKLSWLLRSLGWRRDGDSIRVLDCNGEPKDLFDAHLLVTRADVRPGVFEKAFLAIAAEDELAWNALKALLNTRQAALTDEHFGNWIFFAQQHQHLLDCGPSEMLLTIADRIEPLLADLRQHIPFLQDIKADPLEEAAQLIYADWLEERGDPRGQFLRLCTALRFHGDEMPKKQQATTRQAIQKALQTVSGPWLYHAFGNATRFREAMARIEAR